jgi:hypothetical protein
MVMDLTNETFTPRLLWAPEQFKQRKIPLFTDAQKLEGAPEDFIHKDISNYRIQNNYCSLQSEKAHQRWFLFDFP